MSKKLATLVKEARSNAGLTQEQLAKKVDGLSASDISKIERNEKEPTQEQAKAIAKATGVTQKSLLEAMSKKKTGQSSGSSSSSSSSGSHSSSSGSAGTTSMKLTANEKKLVELYRAADSDTKKSVMKLLKGESSEGKELLNSILENAMESFLKK
ncbi:MAG: helix-turn-helix transcriptional regulator [Eubacteriales bacterium]|nr:helix-turn-helix transcriptional regulator [Eubacteriales bacterium]